MRRARIAAVWLALLVALCAAGVAAAGTGDVVLVSEHGEIEGEEIAAEVPAISGDGRYVAYVRSAFEHGDSIFLAKPGDGPAVAVDVPEGTAESGLSFDAGAPALSADGRYLVFASEDPNLSKEDKDYDRSAACTCPVRDIFVYDRTTRRVSLVSRRGGPHGAAADDDSNLPSISANGRYVAFGTEAHNLKHGLYGGVWLRDLRNNRMTLVSGGRIGGFDPSVSGHGEAVAYTFTARSRPHVNQIGLGHPGKSGRMIVSRASGHQGAPAHDDCGEPSISANGRYVAFASKARNLSSADVNGVEDVFVRDLKTGRTVLVSRASGPHGAGGQGDSSHPSISTNGRYVAFTSYSNNLGPHDDGRVPDVFVRDMKTGRVVLVSGSSGGSANGPSGDPAISGDGRYVAFDSKASNLSPADPDHVVAVFRDQLLP